jgi:protein TonB
MPGLWFEPSERASTPPPKRSWSGFVVSVLGHTLLIGALVWAGKQWVPITPPETIEVMLMELPTEQVESAEPAPVQAPPLQKLTTPKPQPQVAQAKKITEPVKPAPVNEPIAEMNVGEKTPPTIAKTLPAPSIPTVTEPPRTQSISPDVPKEVSPAKVDARYASSNPRPQYPSMARRLGQEGTVILEVTVSVDGLAKSVRIQESSGHELLDQAALNAISKWKFVPAKRGESPIEQKLSTRWTYKLEE